MAAWLVFSSALASVCGALLAVGFWLWANRLQTSAPGPPTLPLLGNVLIFYKQPVLMDRIGQLHKQYGDVFRIYMGPKLVIVVTQPDDIKRVLVIGKQQERDPNFTRLLRIALGNGLITNSKETWKSHRKLIEPAFHFEVILMARRTERFWTKNLQLWLKMCPYTAGRCRLHSKISNLNWEKMMT